MDERRTFNDTDFGDALEELMQAMEELERTREMVLRDIQKREEMPPPE